MPGQKAQEEKGTQSKVNSESQERRKGIEKCSWSRMGGVEVCVEIWEVL